MRMIAGVAFAAALLGGSTAVLAQPRPACGGDRAFHAISLAVTAEQTQTDPAQVWTEQELWNPNTPRHTTIWQGAVPACGGQVIVSQIVNRQCSSAVECPARVVFRTPTETRVLLDYKQVCTMHQDFALRADLSELRSCGQSFALKPLRP